MKIEQIADDQIRCTLTRDDLAKRNMRISEFAYGTEKARGLFRDMMQQAAMQYGFEVGDTPIMIEAVPMNSECLVLVITKVEDPEELDTRFSNFSPYLDVPSDEYDYDYAADDAEEDFFSVFSRIRESSFRDAAPYYASKVTERATGVQLKQQDVTEKTAVFSFPSLHEITALSKSLHSIYNGRNTLFSDEAAGRYLLLLYPEPDRMEQFAVVCARLTEYGHDERRRFSGSDTVSSFLNEHCPVVIADEAIQKLSRM